MTNRYTRVPHIMMPKSGTDLSKWAVVACDQYTSQPDYWTKADEIVGGEPSTLRVTLPEVYLEDEAVSTRISQIHTEMQAYLANGTLAELPAGMVLTERFSGGSCARRGLVLAVDLDAYEYRPGSQSPIRPTEKTVEERIPPRLAVRDGASIELPHIMLLIDDPARSIIEPLFDRQDRFQKLYDTDLMLDGGHINGWFIPQSAETEEIENKLAALCDRETFDAKYHLTERLPVLPFAVGDGNHSMATAKAYWEKLKPTLTEAEQADHPARFALVEVVNIHDESLIIEPIHRVLFGVNAEELLTYLVRFYGEQGCAATVSDADCDSCHSFPFFAGEMRGKLCVQNPKWAIPVATIQTALDAFLASHENARIDYIHGADVVERLSAQAGNLGFLLPDIEKNDLFRGVVIDGVLPRKTFSMGEAHEKRYYMEAKRIIK